MTPLPLTESIIERGMAAPAPLHIGAQLYVSLRGQIIADTAFGEDGRGRRMTPQTLMLWLSAGKPLLAALIGILWERNLLALDDPVARFIPEFAAQGKEGVTLRHLLTHTGGFRGTGATWSPVPWDRLISRICSAPLEPGWIPGLRAGYHLASSWNILAEVIQRITVTPLSDFIRDTLLLPIGMTDTYFQIGEKNGWHGQVILPVRDGSPPLETIGLMHDSTISPPIPQPFDTPENAALLRPGGNVRGPIRQLGLYYETLLNNGTILLPQTIAALTARHRTGMFDETFRRKMDWGLGFMLNSAMYSPPDDPPPYGFGPHASPQTFGHGGSQSVAGFADPVHRLVVAVVFNGMCGELKHTKRIHEVAGAIYEDLGL